MESQQRWNRTTVRGIVVLGPIGSEAEVVLRVGSDQIQLAGLTEALVRMPGREVELVGRFLGESRFFVEGMASGPYDQLAPD